MMQQSILGLWNLASWLQIEANGSIKNYSAKPISGFLYYGADGAMAVSIYELNQGLLLSSYAGTYEYAAGTVIHYPLLGSSPQGIKDRKIRRIHFNAASLTMETDRDQQQKSAYFYRLLWQPQTMAH